MAIWHLSPSRLHAPRHFERQLRHLLRHSPPDGDAFPAAALFSREAPFLQEQYRQLKETLKTCPSLPMEGKQPRLLLLARQIGGHLPLQKGRMLMQIRRFYHKQDMRCREKDMLPAALSLALLEQVQEQLKNALQPAKEDVLLLRQRSLGLTLQALHEMASFSFSAFQDRICPVSCILKADETFRRMDRESRNFYVQRVCHLAKRFSVSETAVARAALSLCEGKEGLEKEAGFYLLEQPRQIAAYLLKPTHALSHRQKSLLFLLPLAGAALLCCLLWASFSGPALLLPFGLLAASEHARKGYAFLLRRFSPPRMLPRLHPRQVKDKQLLVAVPVLLSDEKQAFALARHLRTLHAATPHAHFMLLADFPDSSDLLSDRELALCRTTAAIIQALNQQEENAYLYFHRSRSKGKNAKLYTSRKGKQGALETMNLLLTGKESPDAFVYTSLPPSALANRYSHVLLLHPDTFLPPGAAAQLQGALEHPLQKGRIAIIQPRMETLSASLRTRLQFFLPLGSPEIHSHAMEQMIRKAFGKASFSGQGIYDPALLLRSTRHVLKTKSLRHHAFMEGELSGCGLAEDIVCFAPPPATLARLQRRIHQKARDVLSLSAFFTDAALPFLSRFKIYDHLRFLLVPFSELVLLVSGTLLQSPFLMLLGLPYPFSGMVRRLCLLPGMAYTQMEALFKRHASPGLPLGCLLSSLFSGAAAVIFSLLPGGVVMGLVPGLCFLLPPLFLPYLDQKRPLHPAITEEDALSLRSLCRDTWHFFEKNVHAGTFYLPPDFVQHQPDIGPCRRTSPAAMGLYLLSVLAAREMNLISTAQMLRRLVHAMETMEKMETWQGHFFRAYSLENLRPAAPGVSTADSGILCACLLTCAQGVRSHITPSDTAAASLPERMDHLAHAMRFDALYDPSLSLFFTGYDTKNHQPSAAHHDLLASESRLASYAAIRMGQVPVKHWFRLSRPITRQGGGLALLSLNGTASEYLLPGLMLPFYPRTLLQKGCLNAIRAQLSAALHRPFGLSTSGHFAFDPSLQYITRPFGLPSLSLSGNGEGDVVAPYASMLALPYLPGAALQNLKKMRRLSWYTEDGLFEAADYAPGPMETGPLLVQSHVSAHQAMILCAACNLLTDFSLVRHFMLPAPAMAHHFLLCERHPLAPGLPGPCPGPGRPLFLRIPFLFRYRRRCPPPPCPSLEKAPFF